MSLYNMLFGVNESAPILMAALGLTREDVGRFRDCYIEDNKIAIHTRNGGGNREGYQEYFDELSKHTNYLYDQDDDFDCTYANIYFSFPDEYKDELEALAANSEIIKPSEKWKLLIESLKKD